MSRDTPARTAMNRVRPSRMLRDNEEAYADHEADVGREAAEREEPYARVIREHDRHRGCGTDVGEDYDRSL